MNKKPLLIIFEGVDKSGKTTLRDCFNKVSDFRYVVLDRFTTSSKVYDNVFGRCNFDYYNNVENNLLNNYNVIIVYCDCRKDIILKRLQKANEVLPTKLQDIEKIQALFYEELHKIRDRCKLVFVDTTNDIDTCINKIFDAICEVERS